MSFSPSPLLAQQTCTIPVVGGSTAPTVVLGIASVQVLAPDQSRKSVTFHNPNYPSGGGGIDIMVSQAQDVNGNALAATFYALGPPAIAPVGFILFPGADRTFDGDAAQGAWVACARTGAANGLTIVTSKK